MTGAKNRLRVTAISIGLAYFAAACGQSETQSGNPNALGGSNASSNGGSSSGPKGGSNASSATTTAQGQGGNNSSSSGQGGSTTVAQGGNTTTTGPTGAQGGSTGSSTPQGGSTGSATTGPKGGTSTQGGTSSSAAKGGTSQGTTAQSGGSSGTSAQTSGGNSSGGTVATTAGGASVGGASSTTTAPVTKPKLVTSAENAYWKEGTPTEVTSGTADVTLADGTVYQTFDGFGGSFNEVGWNVLSMLSDADRARALELLFGADGVHFAFGRVPIGASDYALARYTLNETANDYTMEKFSIEQDKKLLIPYIKAALALRSDLRLWASPWTPPSWMKDNNAIDKGNMKDDAKILQAHALYLSKFVEEYAKESIKIEAIHPQNEPGYAPAYPSCMWSAALLNKFIRDYLGPTFADRKVEAQIFLGTMSNADAGMDGTIVSTVTADTATMKYIKGFGMQWNMLDTVSSLTSRKLPIVQSEHKCGNYHWLSSFNPNTAPNDYAYAEESWGLIASWLKAGVNSYSAWNMVLDKDGKNLNSEKPWPQNALLTVDTATKKLTVTPVYYVFRHVSQFVDPGAKRIGTTGSFSDVLAFKNPDGSYVAALYNSGGSARKTLLGVGTAKLQFDIPAHGFATVNWK
ncbi:MAG TPA: glycoside hydrolase family 30 beta sandwich domain-containing protein [Polyangiaceae bacterium]